MIEIIPAVLPKSFEELERELPRLRGISSSVQVDLVGSNVLLGHETFPQWEEFDFECDIMLPDPLGAVQSCIDAGASRIVVHASAKSAREALEFLQKLREGEYPMAVGVALASHDSPDVLKNFKGLYDYVQVMGIERVGSQGQPFDSRAVVLVHELRTEFPDLTIQVDGGVAPHIRELVEAGANRLVVGSAIMRAHDPKAVYKELYTEANAG